MDPRSHLDLFDDFDLGRHPDFADPAETDVSDRRRENRFDVQEPVRYRFPGVRDEWKRGLVLNISLSGASVLLDGAHELFAATLGTVQHGIELEIVLEDSTEAVHVHGCLVWIEPDGGLDGIDRVGVRFIDMSEGDAQRLRTFLGL